MESILQTEPSFSCPEQLLSDFYQVRTWARNSPLAASGLAWNTGDRILSLCCGPPHGVKPRHPWRTSKQQSVDGPCVHPVKNSSEPHPSHLCNGYPPTEYSGKMRALEALCAVFPSQVLKAQSLPQGYYLPGMLLCLLTLTWTLLSHVTLIQLFGHPKPLCLLLKRRGGIVYMIGSGC